jgi:hypothetical protein
LSLARRAAAIARIQTVAVLVALGSSVGCTLLNGIDVCESRPAAIEDLNRRTENDQYYAGMDELIRSTQETWLSTWTSNLEAAAGVNRSDLRIGRLDAAGSPLSTCGEEAELTIVEAPPSVDSESNAYGPSLIASRGESDAPLLIWGYDDGSRTTLYGQMLTNQGCPSLSRGRFVINETDGVCSHFRGRSLSSSSSCSLPFRAAALDTSDDGGTQFVLVWNQSVGLASGTLMARVVEYLAGEKFLPTALDSSGAAGPLLEGAHAVLFFDLVGLSGGRWAIVWVEVATDIQMVWLQVWNDRLEAVGEPIEVHRGAIPDSISLDAAAIGGDIGIVFATATGVYGVRASGEDAGLLAQGEIRRSGSVDWTRIAADGRGQVVVAWTEATAGSDGQDGAPHVLAQLFDENLEPIFNNQACDSAPFGISGGSGTAQREVLAFDPAGGLLVNWTSLAAGGDDRSGWAVRGRYYAPNTLRP